ncbi:hypothetical protein [Gemmata sp.]|uniref:hypothetical protein n=1 Tax=Gemmata sp. TaxID=1914242 RepID=UPI003F6EE4E2
MFDPSVYVDAARIPVMPGPVASPHTAPPRLTATLPNLPCRFRGAATGHTAPCQVCGGGTVQLPLLACSYHGVCTHAGKLGKLPNGNAVTDCAVCRDRQEPAPPAAPLVTVPRFS